MKIAGTEINLAFKAFEIYVSGCCEPHCPGCHNAKLWDFAVGDPLDVKMEEIRQKALDLKESRLAEYVWMLGGEPLDQDRKGILLLLKAVRECGLRPVLWTHYYRVPEEILDAVEYVKVGPYIQDGDEWIEPVFGVKLANREQAVFSSERVSEMQETVEKWTSELRLLAESGKQEMDLAYERFRGEDRFWAALAFSRAASRNLLPFLKIYARMDWSEAGMFALPAAVSGLKSDSADVIEASLQCFKAWNQPKHLKWLEGKFFGEKRLDECRQSVVDLLSKA